MVHSPESKQEIGRPSPISRFVRSSGASLAPVARFLKREAFTLASGIICLAVCYWMITEGTGKLWGHSRFDEFYDAQGKSLMEGHWDVPEAAIGAEAFVRQNKRYGYFGVTPALLRMPLNRVFPDEYGEWTRFLMLTGAAAAIAAIIFFMAEFGAARSPFLLAVFVLGSPLFYLCCFTTVHHEAIMTGTAFALWAYVLFWRYWKHPGLPILAAGLVLSFLSFFARITAGVGPLILAAFLCAALLIRRFAIPWLSDVVDRLEFPSPPNGLVHASLLAIGLAAASLTYVSINHAKFGEWLDPAPYRYHVQYDKKRLERIGGTIIHLSNLPFDLKAYFAPSSIRIHKEFPWVDFDDRQPDARTMPHIDRVEGYASIPATMPATAILALIGIFYAFKRARSALPMIASALIAGSLVLILSYVAYRYSNDFYPFLVISAILGAACVQSISNPHLRVTLKWVILAAGIWSIAAVSALTLRKQCEDLAANPDRRAEYLAIRRHVEFLLSGKAEPIRYNWGDKLTGVWSGEFLTTSDPVSTYRFDGREWRYVSGVVLHQYRLRVQFIAADAGRHMPLWSAGRAGANDTIYIIYKDSTHILFCSDHWGSGGACGPPFEIQPGREYEVQIDADRLNSKVAVSMDSQQVLEAPMQLHAWKESDVLIGRSLAPKAHGSDFAGEIRREQ